MQIIVQKFGGTSLSSNDKRRQVLKHIDNASKKNYAIVVVVSAMGRTPYPYATDTLIDWIRQNGNALPSREMDMLLACGEIISAATLCSLLHADKKQSIVLNGAQAGIRTDGIFGNAHIRSINPYRIIEQLKLGKIVIVTGFQGESDLQECTTLGRGGSDTTAVALGVALHAEKIDIFTDVDGIFTADPKVVENAHLMNQVSYEEMCNLAQQGAKVIHPRAVEIAMNAKVPIYIRSTFTEHEGTLVNHIKATKSIYSKIQDNHVTAITSTNDLTQIHVSLDEQSLESQVTILQIMALHEISIDFINLNSQQITFTIPSSKSAIAQKKLVKHGFQPIFKHACAKVSIVGGGMNGVPGIMKMIVEALNEHQIEILQSADSHSTIWVLVKEIDHIKAVKSLHRKFELTRT